MREKATSFIFVVLLVLFFVLAVIIPKDDLASVMENRPLASAPAFNISAIKAGSFQDDFEKYLSDNIGFRSRFITAGTLLEKIKGVNIIKTKMPKDQVITYPWGTQLVLSRGRIMEVYDKLPDVLAHYVNVLNKYSAEFADDHNMYVMLAPTQLEFDTTEYHDLADSQKESIDEIYAQLINYTTVNVYDKLAAHSNEYIYFRTDHHWTQRGAYYGYCALSEAKGISPLSLEDMTANKYSGFLGYLFNQANVQEYKQFADEIEYFDFDKNYPITIKEKNADGQIVSYQNKMYRLPEGTSANYGLFMGGDFSFIEMDTDVKNGETALIIKDSYANALIPLLANNYEKILVIDPRSYYGTVEQLTLDYDIDDIIFINYALIARNDAFITYIENIMK